MSGDSSDGLTTWALSFLQRVSEIASVIQKAQVDYPPFFFSIYWSNQQNKCLHSSLAYNHLVFCHIVGRNLIPYFVF